MAWYHGSANYIDRFKPVNYGEDTGDPSHYTPQSFESGKGTYLTRDPEEAASFAWSLDDREVDPYDLGDPDREPEGGLDGWMDRVGSGSVPAVDFNPERMATYSDAPGAGTYAEQADAARRSGYDAISSPEMALSFSPHKNLSGMSRMQFQDFDEYGRSPSDFVDEMRDLHAEE